MAELERRTIEAIHDDLRREEGWRGFVYDDATGRSIVAGTTVKGHPTIGYGFNLSALTGRVLPQRVADLWLEILVEDIIRHLLRYLPWLPAQPADVQRALVNMAYQLGFEPFDGDGYKDWPNMLNALKAGDREAAAAHALDSEWARTQTPARARRVAALIRGRP